MSENHIVCCGSAANTHSIDGPCDECGPLGRMFHCIKCDENICLTCGLRHNVDMEPVNMEPADAKPDGDRIEVDANLSDLVHRHGSAQGAAMLTITEWRNMVARLRIAEHARDLAQEAYSKLAVRYSTEVCSIDDELENMTEEHRRQEGRASYWHHIAEARGDQLKAAGIKPTNCG